MPRIDDHVVGECGNCGGAVVVPRAWMGINVPTPTCEQCGATAKPQYGPRLPMNPPPTEWHTCQTRATSLTDAWRCYFSAVSAHGRSGWQSPT